MSLEEFKSICLAKYKDAEFCYGDLITFCHTDTCAVASFDSTNGKADTMHIDSFDCHYWSMKDTGDAETFGLALNRGLYDI